METITRRTAAGAYGSDEERWAAVQRRDRAADGAFFYSVRTTGIYCRPSCGARLPLPQNVRYHATVTEAEQAGFRPCKRCRPAEAALGHRHATAVAQACRRIEAADEPPRLGVLAASAGMSPYHFHRTFKALLGVTPKAYAIAHRAQRVRDELSQPGTITQAIYGAGFNSSGRFYASSPRFLGMTPTEFRSGGTGASIRFAIAECSLGSLLVAATVKGVCAIFMGDDPEALLRALQDRFPKAQLIGADQSFDSWVAKVVGLIEAPGSELALPLDVRGTAFQQRVWRALQEIPPGSTATYSEIAARIGAPKAVRAVAGACAANTLAVVIPCHRVVRTDSSLSGYRWGVERKRALLDREAKR